MALLETFESLRGCENRGTTLPTDAPRDLSPGWHAQLRPHAEHSVTLSLATQEGLRRVARLSGCTYFACVVAVVHAWQRRLTGKDEVVVMVTVDMRDGSTSHLAGSFISDAVLRTPLPSPQATVTFSQVIVTTIPDCAFFALCALIALVIWVASFALVATIDHCARFTLTIVILAPTLDIRALHEHVLSHRLNCSPFLLSALIALCASGTRAHGTNCA